LQKARLIKKKIKPDGWTDKIKSDGWTDEIKPDV
jgi:hypothetical protein